MCSAWPYRRLEELAGHGAPGPMLRKIRMAYSVYFRHFQHTTIHDFSNLECKSLDSLYLMIRGFDLRCFVESYESFIVT